MMEDHTPGDVLEEDLQSPRSPVQSSYGGSDAGDNDVGDIEALDLHEHEVGDQKETEQEEGLEADPDEMEQDEENSPSREENSEDHDEGESNGEQQQVHEERNENGSAAVVGQSVSQSANASAEGPRYKYKYPEAYPTPPGWEDEKWNKAYTAADSRIYNHAKKNHQVSRQKRIEGLTREEAIKWEEQRAEREAKKGHKSTSAPKQQTPRAAASPSAQTASIQTPSTDAEMGNKKNQKKRKAPAAVSAVPIATGSSQLPNQSIAAIPEDLSLLGATQTLADRIKGKSAASAAVFFSVEPSSLVRAESEKVSLAKKGGAGAVKKQPVANSHLQTPPVAKTQSVSRVTASKPRGSKSGTPAFAPNNLYLGSDLEQFSDDEADGDEMATYCVCNGPESTYMISCDSCEDWFHRRVSCLGEGDVALFKELADHIDHWYCPPCRKKDPSLAVTWYRGCRRQLCTKRARVDSETPSKYCSDECAIKFFEEKIAQAAKGSEPSRGGALTQYELSMLLKATNSAADFKTLGLASPKLRVKGKTVSKQFLRNIASMGLAGADADEESARNLFENKAEYKGYKENGGDDANERRGLTLARQQMHERYNQVHEGPPLSEDELRVGFEVALGAPAGITSENYLEIDWGFLQRHGAINPSEAQTIDELQTLMKYNADWIGVASLKETFMKALHKHVEEILKLRKSDFKTVCGFLPQISMSDHEFREWLGTPEGVKICKTGKYEPLDPSQVGAWKKKSEQDMCMHSPKKHATHHRWYEVHDRENVQRVRQFMLDFNDRLKELQELMTMLEMRIYGEDWDGTA